MTIELNREAIARIAALPGVAEAAEAGSALISLWPLTEAMQMDNDAKYAENLQVRVTRAFARASIARLSARLRLQTVHWTVCFTAQPQRGEPMS